MTHTLFRPPLPAGRHALSITHCYRAYIGGLRPRHPDSHKGGKVPVYCGREPILYQGRCVPGAGFVVL